jgi:hypothetical protein
LGGPESAPSETIRPPESCTNLQHGFRRAQMLDLPAASHRGVEGIALTLPGSYLLEFLRSFQECDNGVMAPETKGY